MNPYIESRGTTIAAVAEAAGIGRLRAADGAAAIDFDAVSGEPFISLRGGGIPARVFWLASGETAPAVPSPLLARAVAAAWPGALPEQQPSPRIAKLYAVAEYLPREAKAFITPGAQPTHIYIDELTARVLIVIDPSRVAYAWVFYALHTLQFPGLNTHPTVRTGLVLALLAFGTAFSVTGVILGVKHLQRELA